MDAQQIRNIVSTMRTVPISTEDASGNTTIHSTQAGLYFVVFHIFINTSATINLTVKSGSTPITGAVPMVASTDLEWISNDVPLFKGRAAGDAFVLNTSAATNLRGFAVLCEAI